MQNKTNAKVLGGFFDEAPETVLSDYMEIKCSEIQRSPFNTFRIVDIDELVESIKKHGQLHNVVVRPMTNPDNPEIKYELISGERRWEAQKRIGNPLIAKVIECNDLDAKEKVIIANLDTRIPNEMERSQCAIELEQIIEEQKKTGKYKGLRTRDVVADKMSTEKEKVNPSTVGQLKKLQDLIPEFKAQVESGELSRDKAYQYAQMSEEQQRLVYDAFEQGKALSGKEAKDLKDKLNSSNDEQQKVINELKEQLDLKKKEADTANEAVRNLQDEKERIEKESNGLREKLDKAKKDIAEKDKAKEQEIQKIKAALQKEIEKDVKQQNKAEIKRLNEELNAAVSSKENVKDEYEKRIEELTTKLNEKEEQKRKKEIEENVIEGNKAIQSMAKQTQKAFSVLFDEISRYKAVDGFMITDETKKIIAEIMKYEADILNS